MTPEAISEKLDNLNMQMEIQENERKRANEQKYIDLMTHAVNKAELLMKEGKIKEAKEQLQYANELKNHYDEVQTGKAAHPQNQSNKNETQTEKKVEPETWEIDEKD